ncbi:MAG TPA: MCE family protein [Streptosporangiaceae bacterium]|nr:MCE family protein [Streptosporangiaceae bacterium]
MTGQPAAVHRPAARRPGRALRAAAAVVACTATVSGCQFSGLGTLPLPFLTGTGSGSYTVTAVLGQTGNLPVNAQVMVNDVPVGTVTAIRFDHWHARLTISLPRRVQLPANATATIGQKSLFGAEYVALGPPPDAPPAGRLHGGDVIPLARTSTYPSTEDVLAALSTALNGGGLNQLATITTELNAALHGHEQQARALLANLRRFAATLDGQRTAIIRTLTALDALSAQLRAGDRRLARAIDSIPAGLAVLNKNEKNLTAALAAVSNLSTVAGRVITETRQNLLANLHDLRPALRRLAGSGQNLVNSLPMLATFPFPGKALDRSFKGDYANLYLSLDLTLGKLEKAWLTGAPLAGGLTKLGKPSTRSRNPLTTPVLGLGGKPGGKSGGKSGGGAATGSGSGSGGSSGGGILGWLLGGGNG